MELTEIVASPLTKDATSHGMLDFARDCKRAQRYARAAEMAMRSGNVALIRTFLRDHAICALIEEFAVPDGKALTDMVKAWFADAEAYEAVHGWQSLLDRNDPFIKDILLPAQGWFLENRRKLQGGPLDPPPA